MKIKIVKSLEEATKLLRANKSLFYEHIEQIPQNSVYIFKNGRWFDKNGVKISLSRQKIKDIIQKISDLETEKYSEYDESLICLSDAESLQDIADYLEADISDIFIFFKDVDEHSDVFYMLAAKHQFDEIIDYDRDDICAEVADICGNLTVYIVQSLINSFIAWLKQNNIVLYFCDCRKSTSYRLLMNRRVKQYFKDNDFYDIQDINENNDNDPLITVVFVDKNWYNSLSVEEKNHLKEFID